MPYSREGYSQFTSQLPTVLRDRLRKHAAKLGQPMQAIVELALKDYFKAQRQPKEKSDG